MFVGHFGVGLSGKAGVPRVSLGTWFLSVQFLDLLWPVFLVLDWEHVRITPGYTRMSPLDFYDYPISHSLLGAALWAALFAVAYSVVRRRDPKPERRRAALLLAGGVLSHWLLDFLTHRPDLPVLPSVGPYLGLGLWNYPAVEILLEALLYGAGIALYLRATRARDNVGRFALAGLLVLLAALWLGASFGPPPGDERVLAWSALSIWLIVPWAYWIDRHREARTGTAL